MLRRTFFSSARRSAEHRITFHAAAGRAMLLLLERDPVFSQVSFADRARIAAASLEQLAVASSAAENTLDAPDRQTNAVPSEDATNNNNRKKDSSADSVGGGDKSETQESKTSSAPVVTLSQLAFHAAKSTDESATVMSMKTSNTNLARAVEILGLDVADFEQYRESIHFHLLAGLPQQDLAADVAPAPRRIAVIFRLMRSHGFQERYSDSDVQAAKRDVEAHFSERFITSNFAWSSDQEKYLRRRLLVDAAVHRPLLLDGGTPQDLCKMAWILLFDALKSRFPRRAKPEPVPAMLYLHASRGPELDQLPFLERVAAMLRDPQLQSKLDKAEATYNKALKTATNPRAFKGDVDRALMTVMSPERLRQSAFHPWSSSRILEKTERLRPPPPKALPTNNNGTNTSINGNDNDGNKKGLKNKKSDAPLLSATVEPGPLHEDAWSLWLKRQSEQQSSPHEIDCYSNALKALTGGDLGVPLLPSVKRLTPRQLEALNREAELALQRAQVERKHSKEEESSRTEKVTEQGQADEARRRSATEDAEEQHDLVMQRLDAAAGRRRRVQMEKIPDALMKAVVAAMASVDAELAAMGCGFLSRRLLRIVKSAVASVTEEDLRERWEAPPDLMLAVEQAMSKGVRK